MTNYFRSGFGNAYDQHQNLIASTLTTGHANLDAYMGAFLSGRLQNSFELLKKVDPLHLTKQVEENISENATLEEIALLVSLNGCIDQKRKINLQLGKIVSGFMNPLTEEDNIALQNIGADCEDESAINAVIIVRQAEDNLKSLGYKLSSNTNQRDLLAKNLMETPDLLQLLDSEILSKYLIFDSGAKGVRIRFSETVPQQESFLRTIIESEHSDTPITVFAPVCPDYSNEDYSLRFGVSSTARVTMESIKKMISLAQKSRLNFSFHILVADTEDDLPETLERLTNGDLFEFRSRTRQSVDEIAKEFESDEYDEMVQVGTFTDYFSESFRQTQYAIEAQIRELLPRNADLQDEFVETSRERADKYRLILGHSEKDHLLSIRYAAQYAALAYLTKQNDQPTALMNYSTPNLKYFVGGKYRLITGDTSPDLPIIEVIF